MVPEPASTGPAGYDVGRRFQTGTYVRMCYKEPRMPKMDAMAADIALAVWNVYVWDARRHARQWRPVEQALQGSNEGRGSQSSCQKQVVFT